MTKTFNYEHGDTVEIKPYNLFGNDPAPIKWTADAYGYGHEYKPGDTFIYERPTYIYGLYNPVYMHYCLIDERNTPLIVRYENRIGNRIEIAGSFFLNNSDGFVCWNDIYGNVLSAGQFITLSTNISVCVSCEYHFTATYDINGGKGHIESQHGIMNRWVEINSAGRVEYKYTYPTIILHSAESLIPPDSSKEFNYWLIDGEPHNPGDAILLRSDITVIAKWNLIQKFNLDASTICINNARTFRYLMLRIISTRNNSSLALSKILLLNNINEQFNIPLGTRVITGLTSAIALINGTSGNNFKISRCSFPYNIVYDFGIQCLNTQIYNTWNWHNASDSASNTGSCIKRILLLFSNDNVHWFLADDAFDERNTFPTINNSIAYTNTFHTIDYYYIYTSTSIPSIGTVNIHGDIYNMNKKCTATANSNYEFVEWKGDDFLRNQIIYNEIALYNPINIIINDYSSTNIRHDISACFTYKTQYTISVSINDTAGGHITGAGSQFNNNIFTLNAIPNTNYTFKEWIGHAVLNTKKYNERLSLSLSKNEPFLHILAIFEHNGLLTIFEYTDGTVEYKTIVGEFTYKDIGYRSHYTLENFNIKKISFGVGITKICEYACANCKALEAVEFIHLRYNTTDNPTLYTIELNQYAFFNCNNLVSFDFSCINSLTIPDHAFDSCTKLNNLIFRTTKNIGNYAFYNCTSLKTFDFSKVNNEIRIGAFKNSGIQTITTLPNRLNYLSDECFMGCNSLTTLIIPSTIRSLGQKCFLNCNQLKTINLTSYVNSIPTITSTTFSPVNSISGRIFSFKSTTESLLAYNNTIWKEFHSLITPRISSETELVFKIDKNTLKISFTVAGNCTITVNWGDGSNIETIEILSGKSISHIYRNKKGLNINVKIVGPITSISCENKKQLIQVLSLAYSITSLPDNAFKNTQLESLTIPSTLLNIGTNILYNTPITLSNIHITNGFIINDIWGILANGTLVKLFNKSSTVTSFNALETNLSYLSLSCFNTANRLLSISLPNTLQNISVPIISRYGLPNLTSITIGAGSKYSVINNMLMSCEGAIILTTKSANSIPTTAVRLCLYSFTNTELTSLVIPRNITTIDVYAFCNNMRLNSITVPFTKAYVERAASLLSHGSWFYGGIDYETVNNDLKLRTRELTITCSDGTLQTVLTTDAAGYLKQPLNPSKVKLLSISLDYANTSNSLPGMTNDSNRISQLLEGFANVREKIINNDATLANVTAKLLEYVNNSADDELFIFHYSGHGGQSRTNNTRTYMCLYDDDFYDNDFWNIISAIKGRAMAIFCCCHAGTMFLSTLTLNTDDTLQSNTMKLYPNWAKSAKQYFTLDSDNTVLSITDSDDIEEEDEMIEEDSINFIDSDSVSMLVYSACTDDELSWMTHHVGHALMTSLVNNFNRSNKLYTYYDLFINATTPNEESTLSRREDGKTYEITPLMTIIGGFNYNIRAFT